MNKIELIQSVLEDAKNLRYKDEAALDKLIRRAPMILKNIGKEKPYAAQLYNIHFHSFDGQAHPKTWTDGKKAMINLLETVLEELQTFGDNAEKKKTEVKFSNKIFIVHGHDTEMKTEVASALRKLGLEPIILHEHPDKGRTVIEKFTDYSDVNYAVVLLSPDDYGYSKDESVDKAKFRARQNVILELGFFLGKLGRGRVIVIHRVINNFEFPSDYSGVIYKPFDKPGNWQFQLVKELKAIGYDVSADKII
jgi:predicted nucleotide-binding protein